MAMPRGKRFETGYTAITREDVEKVASEGLITADAAHVLGVHRSTLWKYRKKWPGIQFPNSGQSKAIAAKGYAV